MNTPQPSASESLCAQCGKPGLGVYQAGDVCSDCESDAYCLVQLDPGPNPDHSPIHEFLRERDSLPRSFER